MVALYVDADASPAKNEAIRVVKRYGHIAYLASNFRIKIPEDQLVKM